MNQDVVIKRRLGEAARVKETMEPIQLKAVRIEGPSAGIQPSAASAASMPPACDEGGLDIDATVQGLLAFGCDGQVVEGKCDPVLLLL